MNQLKIGNFKFEIDPETSFLEEYNDDFTKWNLRINTKEGVFDEEYACAPNLRCESMMAEIGSVRSLVGTAFDIKAAYNYVTDEHLFTFYLASHSAVKDNQITFGWIEDGKIQIAWHAVIEDLYFNDAFSENVPFSLLCAIPVTMLAEGEYRSPSVVVNEFIAKKSNDYETNRQILSEIDEITQTYTLDAATYDNIIQLLCNTAFVNTFAGHEKDLDFFIANFTYYPMDRACAIPNGIGEKAKVQWRAVEVLKGIVDKV
jgi:hypothetical protein